MVDAVDAINPVRIRMKLVVAVLHDDDGKHQQAGRQADGQAKDVDKGKNAVLQHAPQGDFEVVADHHKVWVMLFGP